MKRILLVLALVMAITLTYADNPKVAPWADNSIEITLPGNADWHAPLMVEYFEVEYWLIKLSSTLNAGTCELHWTMPNGTTAYTWWSMPGGKNWSYSGQYEGGQTIRFSGYGCPGQWCTRIGVGITVNETCVAQTTSVGPQFHLSADL